MARENEKITAPITRAIVYGLDNRSGYEHSLTERQMNDIGVVLEAIGVSPAQISNPVVYKNKKQHLDRCGYRAVVRTNSGKALVDISLYRNMMVRRQDSGMAHLCQVKVTFNDKSRSVLKDLEYRFFTDDGEGNPVFVRADLVADKTHPHEFNIGLASERDIYGGTPDDMKQFNRLLNHLGITKMHVARWNALNSLHKVAKKLLKYE